MSYTPSTDFVALLRSTAGGQTLARMPGLDYAIEALARAGLINLYVGPTAPLVNQNVTVWFQPAASTWSAEGVVFLWNPALSVYQAATPSLWALLLSGATPSSAIPLQDATPGAVGSSLAFARADHVHPTDTTLAPLASPTFTGTPSAPTPATGDKDNSIATTAFVQTTVNLAAPIGSVVAYAGAAAPTNWAVMNGQAISRTVNAVLFAAIGTLYGSGDGTTTFNLPDVRGRVIAGVDGGVGRLTTATMSSQALAGVGGAETHAITQAELAAHFHAAGISDPTHNHAFGNNPQGLLGGGTFNFGTIGGAGAGVATLNAAATGVLVNGGPNGNNNTYTTGSGAAHINVQPTMQLNYLMRIL